MTAEERSYYASHSRMSDPGPHTRLLDALPVEPDELAAAVAGLVLHPLFIKAVGVTPHPASADDVESRTVAAILQRLVARDPAPLSVARPPERRFVGICRDYALLACAALRHHGVPTRTRVGFATYFVRGFHDDHWVCEYYAGDRWRLLDPELGSPRVRDYFNIMFPVSDVPRDAFLVAGATWRAIRHGQIDPATCGVHAHDLRGAWFVAGNVVKDLAALNKREMLAWDYWGLARDLSPRTPDISDAARARLDEVADVTSPRELDWKTVRGIYDADESLRVSSRIWSSGPSGPREVAVDV